MTLRCVYNFNSADNEALHFSLSRIRLDIDRHVDEIKYHFKIGLINIMNNSIQRIKIKNKSSPP